VLRDGLVFLEVGQAIEYQHELVLVHELVNHVHLKPKERHLGQVNEAGCEDEGHLAGDRPVLLADLAVDPAVQEIGALGHAI
jgi:hypothetical protein